MSKRQIHFNLNPNDSVESRIIQALDAIPGRGVKAYICGLILDDISRKGTAVAPITMQRPVEQLPAQSVLPGQMSVDEFISVPATEATEATQEAIVDDVSDTEKIPLDILNDIAGFNND